MVKYQKEIDKIIEMFVDSVKEDWMDYEDLILAKTEIQKEVNYEQLDKDIETGINNGYSLEFQLNLIRKLLSNTKK